jgi:hypothetical protein
VSDKSLVLENEDSLLAIILDLGESYSCLLDKVRYEFLSIEGISRFCDEFDYDRLTSSIWSSLCRRLKGVNDPSVDKTRYLGIELKDSKIVASFPLIFSEFAQKRFVLLYRGSRDGFDGSSFHRHCDGKSHTITIVETSKGFIFGGYTPLSWESQSTSYKPDDSQQSFVFTLKNQTNTSPKRFALKPDRKQYAIYCRPDYGPTFGGGHDFCISHNVQGAPTYTNFGNSYTNDTGHDGPTFLAGEQNFTVKEIEVFQMSD